jgi:hypothetical protein
VSRLVLAAILVCATARAAAAHQSSVKYLDVTASGGRAELALRLAPGDVTEPMRLAPDARPTAIDAARAPAVATYVASWVTVASRGMPCIASAPTARPDEDGRLVVVTWTVRCSADDRLELDLRRLFALDARQIVMLHAEVPTTQPIDAAVRASDPTLMLDVAAPSVAWLRTGFERALADGAIVIALLAALVLARDESWRVRSIGDAARRAAIALAAFATSALVSVVAGALGWIAVPTRLADGLGALSVVYVAVDGMVAPKARHRSALALGFGVAHGLALGGAAPAGGLALGAFAAGGGLGWAAVGLAGLAVMLLAARRLGGPAYRRYALPLLSVLAAIAAGVSAIGR